MSQGGYQDYDALVDIPEWLIFEFEEDRQEFIQSKKKVLKWLSLDRGIYEYFDDTVRSVGASIFDGFSFRASTEEAPSAEQSKTVQQDPYAGQQYHHKTSPQTQKQPKQVQQQQHYQQVKAPRSGHPQQQNYQGNQFWGQSSSPNSPTQWIRPNTPDQSQSKQPSEQLYVENSRHKLIDPEENLYNNVNKKRSNSRNQNAYKANNTIDNMSGSFQANFLSNNWDSQQDYKQFKQQKNVERNSGLWVTYDSYNTREAQKAEQKLQGNYGKKLDKNSNYDQYGQEAAQAGPVVDSWGVKKSQKGKQQLKNQKKHKQYDVVSQNDYAQQYYTENDLSFNAESQLQGIEVDGTSNQEVSIAVVALESNNNQNNNSLNYQNYNQSQITKDQPQEFYIEIGVDNQSELQKKPYPQSRQQSQKQEIQTTAKIDPQQILKYLMDYDKDEEMIQLEEYVINTITQNLLETQDIESIFQEDELENSVQLAVKLVLIQLKQCLNPEPPKQKTPKRSRKQQEPQLGPTQSIPTDEQSDQTVQDPQDFSTQRNVQKVQPRRGSAFKSNMNMEQQLFDDDEYYKNVGAQYQEYNFADLQNLDNRQEQDLPQQAKYKQINAKIPKQKPPQQVKTYGQKNLDYYNIPSSQNLGVAAATTPKSTHNKNQTNQGAEWLQGYVNPKSSQYGRSKIDPQQQYTTKDLYVTGGTTGIDDDNYYADYDNNRSHSNYNPGNSRRQGGGTGSVQNRSRRKNKDQLPVELSSSQMNGYGTQEESTQEKIQRPKTPKQQQEYLFMEPTDNFQQAKKVQEKTYIQDEKVFNQPSNQAQYKPKSTKYNPVQQASSLNGYEYNYQSQPKIPPTYQQSSHNPPNYSYKRPPTPSNINDNLANNSNIQNSYMQSSGLGPVVGDQGYERAKSQIGSLFGVDPNLSAQPQKNLNQGGYQTQGTPRFSEQQANSNVIQPHVSQYTPRGSLRQQQGNQAWGGGGGGGGGGYINTNTNQNSQQQMFSDHRRQRAQQVPSYSSNQLWANNDLVNMDPTIKQNQYSQPMMQSSSNNMQSKNQSQIQQGTQRGRKHQQWANQQPQASFYGQYTSQQQTTPPVSSNVIPQYGQANSRLQQLRQSSLEQNQIPSWQQQQIPSQQDGMLNNMWPQQNIGGSGVPPKGMQIQQGVQWWR